MAFRKTQGRSVTVSPAGMPNLSGYKQFAGQIDKLSDATMSIGTDIRRQEFNEMLIQAESEGRTAGMRYDKNNNLVPLVDTTYASAIKAYGTSEQKALQAAYKKSALTTYGSQLAIDAAATADAALAKTPNDPNAINGAAKGYLDRLEEELESDVFSTVAGRVNAEFQVRTSRARSAQIQETRENAIATSKIRIGDINQKLGVIATVGAGTDQEAQEGTAAMTQELLDELDDNYKVLELNGVPESEIQQMRRDGNAQVVLLGAKANIEKIYYDTESGEGGFGNALAFAVSFESATRADASINSDLITDSMIAHVRKLKAVTDANVSASEQNQIDIVSNTKLKISTGQIDSELDILQLPIDDARKAILLGDFRSYQKSEYTTARTREDDIFKENKEIFDGYVSGYLDTTLSQDDRDNFRVRAEAMYEQGLIKNSTWLSFVKTRNTELKKQLLAEGQAGLLDLEHVMSPAGGYIISPNAIRNIESELVRKGFVGEGAALSLNQFRKSIRDYETRHKVHHDKIREVNRAVSNARNGVANKADKKIIVDRFAPALTQDGEGNIFNHADPAVAQENIDQAIGFSVKFKFVHPDLVNLMNSVNNPVQESEVYNLAQEVYNSLFLTLSQGINRAGTAGLGVGELQAEKYMQDAGIDTTTFNMLRFVGPKDWQAINAANMKTNTGGKRMSSSIEATFGADLTEVIKSNFNDAVEPSSFLESVQNNVFFFDDSTRSPADLAKLDQISIAPDADISDAFIRDPRFMSYLQSAVPALMVRHNLPQTEEGMQLAIRSAVVAVSDSIGVNIDENGDSYIGFNTWYKSASQSIGSNIDVIPDGSVADAFYREVRRSILRPDFAYDQSIIDMVNDTDGTNLRVVPEEVFGRDQTYTVYMVSEEGVSIPVLTGFHYDYNRSLDNKIVEAAIQRTKSTTVRNFFSQMSLLSPSIVQGFSNDILNDLDEDSSFFDSDTMLLDLEEKINATLNTIKPVLGIMKPGAGVITTPTIDAADVQVLRDWASGKFSDQEYLEELEKVYSNE